VKPRAIKHNINHVFIVFILSLKRSGFKPLYQILSNLFWTPAFRLRGSAKRRYGATTAGKARVIRGA
jgi:hypothetical protein